MTAETAHHPLQESAARLETALVSDELADRVELVVRPLGANRYRAAAVDGSVEFVRSAADGRYDYSVTATIGRDPLAKQSPGAIAAFTEELLSFPVRTDNSYPNAFDSIAQFFDGEHAPDLVALHTAAHHSDGNLGQHGSLGVVQARAPFIVAGAGVHALGAVDRATRTVDIAPTVARLLGFGAHPQGRGPTGEPRADALLLRQDGDPEFDVLDGEIADHVVVVLLDGCNPNLLHDVIQSNEAPHLASLVDRGTAYRFGAMASLPTATLANHTTEVTGAHPGHSGILHNTWLDRSDGSTPDLLAMDQMFWASRHLAPGVETVFEALTRNRPGSFSSATFEFCDRGATYSSFVGVRNHTGALLPDIDDVAHVDRTCADSSDAYRFMSTVDHVSLQHTIDGWRQLHGNPLPALSWCSLAVTDEAGHESGPHGELARAAIRDSDARIGELLRAVESAGALEDTAVVIIGDHGMEQSDAAVDRPWRSALEDTGIAHRDIGGGLIYLD